MKCEWQLFLKLLPSWLQEPVDRLGKACLTELRLRSGQAPELILYDRSIRLDGQVTAADLNFCVNVASQYSPWASASVANGYLTAQGGHRIGICGEAVISDGICTGFRTISSLCLRVARDYPGVSEGADDYSSSLLVIGPPGSGKTTFLRDLIRNRSRRGTGSIAVVDERCEIFPIFNGTTCFHHGERTDILSGISKDRGCIALIRCMGPSTVAVDEVTAEEDCQALIQAAWCGVYILATAHANSVYDLYHRAVYRPLIESMIFDKLVILQRDKSWSMERMYYDS